MPAEISLYEVRLGVYATRKDVRDRVGLLASQQRMDRIREEITRVACPEPEHCSPCPVPLPAGYIVETADKDEAENVYLEQRYGHLRRSVTK